MGTLSPAILPLAGTAASSVFPVAGPLVSAGLGGLAAVRRIEAAKAAEASVRGAARNRLDELHHKRAVEERHRLHRMRREQASRRAQFGAAGLLSSRSADAVLEGLRQETERTMTEGRTRDRLRIHGINQATRYKTDRIRRGAQDALLDDLLGF